MPRRLRPDRRRQRLDATARRELAAALGARVVREPRRGFGAACFAGLLAATGGRRLLHGLRRVARPARAAARRRAGPRPASADLVLGARRARPRRLAAARAARQRRARLAAAPARRRRADRPRADARRPPRPRCSRSASRTAASAGRWRWCCARPRRAGGSTRCRSPTCPRVGRSKVTGTVRGTLRAVRDMRAVLAMSAALIVIAKAPVAGPRQDAADAAVHARAGRARSPRPRWRHAGARSPPCRARAGASARSTARPATWLPAGFEVIPQRGDGLDERLAAAFADVGEPAFLVGMDTPQVTPALLPTRWRACDRTDAVARPRARRRLLGDRPARAPTRALFARRADERARHRRARSARGCASSAYGSASCPRCATSTRSPTRARSRALAPRGARSPRRSPRSRRASLTARRRPLTPARLVYDAALDGRVALTARDADGRAWPLRRRALARAGAAAPTSGCWPGASGRCSTSAAGPAGTCSRSRSAASTALGRRRVARGGRRRPRRAARRVDHGSVFDPVPARGALGDGAAARRQRRHRRRPGRAAAPRRARCCAPAARSLCRGRRAGHRPARRARCGWSDGAHAQRLVPLGAASARTTSLRVARAAGLARRPRAGTTRAGGSRSSPATPERRRPGPFAAGVLEQPAARRAADRRSSGSTLLVGDRRSSLITGLPVARRLQARPRPQRASSRPAGPAAARSTGRRHPALAVRA